VPLKTWKECVGLPIARYRGVTLIAGQGAVTSASPRVDSIERGLFTSVGQPGLVARSTTIIHYGGKPRTPDSGQRHTDLARRGLRIYQSWVTRAGA